MFVERLNSKQNRICSARIVWKCAAKSEVFTSLPQMTQLHLAFLAEISNINIFHITQNFWVKTYKRDQWSLPNILAYISGIFDGFFKAGLVPLTKEKYTENMSRLLDRTRGNPVLLTHTEWLLISPVCPHQTIVTGAGFSDQSPLTTVQRPSAAAISSAARLAISRPEKHPGRERRGEERRDGELTANARGAEPSA